MSCPAYPQSHYSGIRNSLGRALVGTAISALLFLAPAAPVDASTVKFRASGGATALHRLGYFRLYRTSNLQVDWTKSSDRCGIEVDIFKTHDPNGYYRNFIIAPAHSYPGPDVLIAQLRGRYKVQVESNCARWSFVIAKV